MAPLHTALVKRILNVEKPADPDGAILEAWAQGFMVGSLLVMACVAFSNMRRGVLLHKLILLELFCGMFHGTFIFTHQPVYHWYLSVTAIFLNFSWSLHNVIAWMKNKPLLPRWGSILYISSVILVQPYWILEITANFLYFGNKSNLFVYTRPYEALFRDPWWIFTTVNLLYNIKTKYEFGLFELMRVSPRFAVLIGSMLMSISFIIVDILSVTHVIKGRGLPDGINPFWKLAFVFKCLTDTIILDDFKTALDRLSEYRMRKMGSVSSDGVRAEFDAVRAARRERDRLENLKNIMGPTGLPLVITNDWAHDDRKAPQQGYDVRGEHCDDIDLEAALRMDSLRAGESSRSSQGSGDGGK